MDGDGLTAYEEVMTHGTDPAKADSDGDGLADGWEIGVGRFSLVGGTTNRSWLQARNDAKARGGDLASFPTRDSWDRMIASIGVNALDAVVGAWIGANDVDVDGDWRWVNGRPFSFSQWGTSRPTVTAGNTLDYLEVSGASGAEPWKWFDRATFTARTHYILEMGYSTDPRDGDSDDDGLTDGTEATAGSNPFLTDSDGDGLSDTQEVQLTGTHPGKADTDNDGTPDGTDDQDGDTLGNLAEIVTHGTDPKVADTDGDGLSDGVEVSINRGFFKVITGSFTQAQAAADAATRRGRLAALPQDSEFVEVIVRARQATEAYLWLGLSDEAAEGVWKWSDGSTLQLDRWLSGQPNGGAAENHALLMEKSQNLADGAAAFVAGGYLFERRGLDPRVADTDGDGLSDGAEQNIHLTDAFDPDSDNDTLSDGDELSLHKSNPKSTDTDNDGLSDRDEVVLHKSNPSNGDTDNDGFDDLFEVRTGFSPLLATSTPDAISSIRTAVEFRFNAAAGVSYRIEGSTDLKTWSPVEASINGTGGVVTRFYSTENQPQRYFRVRRN